jgi:hypothetical protein
MGLLSALFKKAFKEKVPSIEEREMEEVVKAADNIFVGEKKEKKLFFEETKKVQELIALARDLVRLSAKTYGYDDERKLDPDLRLLHDTFVYLRTHTIDKLNSLRRIHRAAVIIVAEAQQCEKYDRMLKMITVGRSKKYRRVMLKKKLADLDAIRFTMRDVDKKAEEIDETIDLLKSNTQNMLRILRGQATSDMVFGNVNLPKLLKDIIGMHIYTAKVNEIRWIIKDLIKILKAELVAILSLYDNIHKIEIRERRIVRLMKQTGVKRAA